jgi:electron transfer flavoprotein beta subunit
MGIERLTVLNLSDRCDPLAPIADYLTHLEPEIILMGSHSETGEGSGFFPYALAEILGVAIAPAIIEVVLNDQEVHLVQALRGGKRRLISASVPILVAVDKAAPEPRQSAFAKARRGRIETLPATAQEDSWVKAWQFGPVGRGERRVTPSGGSLTERLASATEVKHGAGKRLANPAPDEAALAIYSFLTDNGCLDPTSPFESR